jgi:hypothetical protein
MPRALAADDAAVGAATAAWLAVHRPVSEWRIDRADSKLDQTLLELAAGTGETGFLAAPRLGGEGWLLSGDFARDGAAAERVAKDLGIANLGFRVLDAERIEFDDASVGRRPLPRPASLTSRVYPTPASSTILTATPALRARREHVAEPLEPAVPLDKRLLRRDQPELESFSAKQATRRRARRHRGVPSDSRGRALQRNQPPKCWLSIPQRQLHSPGGEP